MQIQRTGDAALVAELGTFATQQENATWEADDMYGNMTYWFRLDTPALLYPAAVALKAKGARLTMVSACRRDTVGTSGRYISYHFALKGIVYTLRVTLTDTEDFTPSITPIFANADWHEREMIELYGINVTGQPNDNRLFLDEKLDAGLLEGAVPLSVMMNGACTTDLWERVLNGREDGEEKK